MNAHLAPLPAGDVTGFAHLTTMPARRTVAVSPLQLADRILSLAQAADSAGHPNTAAELLTVMFSVLERPH